MIVADTSVLIGSLTGAGETLPALRQAIDLGEDLRLPAIVLFEWRRGPRVEVELEICERLFPGSKALAFGLEEAVSAASIYRAVSRPRGREIDICIASFAIVRGVPLWTLNRKDFRDIPGLKLWNAPSVH